MTGVPCKLTVSLKEFFRLQIIQTGGRTFRLLEFGCVCDELKDCVHRLGLGDPLFSSFENSFLLSFFAFSLANIFCSTLLIFDISVNAL
jgi:hypothetical protein